MYLIPQLAVLASSLLAVSSAQSLSDRANELGLKQTWTAPMGDGDSANGFLKDQWGVSTANFYGNSDVKFETDPITQNGTVLSIVYPAGSYSPSGSKANDGSMGGAEFNAAPIEGNFDAALLSYDLAFAENFDWVLGGKLPGLFGGRIINFFFYFIYLTENKISIIIHNLTFFFFLLSFVTQN